MTMTADALAKPVLTGLSARNVPITSMDTLTAKVCSFQMCVLVQCFYGFYFSADCECDQDGSTKQQCDDNGKCTCKQGFIGDKCKYSKY